MSKSLGTNVDPLEAAERLGPDPLRLYLAKEIPFGQDGDFTWERFEERYNVDLANNLGNLVNRVAVMIHKYRQGRVASVPGRKPQLADVAAGVVGRYREAMDRHEIHTGIAAAFELVDATNEFITRSEPWGLAKALSREAELDQILFEIAEAVRIASILLSPVMPGSCTEILRRMGDPRPLSELQLDRDVAWSGWERQVIEGAPLWPRLEATGMPPDVSRGKAKGSNKRDTPGAGAKKTMTNEPALTDRSLGENAVPEAATPPVEPEKPRVSFDTFLGVELRVAKVLAAEPIPKSKKLLKVTVHDGTEERTVVAGIARAYAPETLVGRSVVIVANLETAKLMGVESNGMILAATDPEGNPVLLSLDDPAAAPPGARVR